jgi:hypothetical protein
MSCDITSLMIKTELVLETSVSFIHLTQLIVRDYFIESCRRESYRSYRRTWHPYYAFTLYKILPVLEFRPQLFQIVSVIDLSLLTSIWRKLTIVPTQSAKFPPSSSKFHFLLILLIDYNGVRLCLRPAATNGTILHPPGDISSWRAMVMMMMPAGDNSWLVHQSSLAV